MKKGLYTLLAMIFVSAFPYRAIAQSTICNDLCVNSITLDSVIAGQMNIEITLNGTSNWINYPYPAYVFDSNGDTIATGQMTFFGQASGMTMIYPTTTTLTSIPSGFTCTIEFVFDTNVCILSFPCSPQSVESISKTNNGSLYPNPTQGHVTLETILPLENASIELYDAAGTLIRKIDDVNGSEQPIDVNNLAKGCYIVTAKQNNIFIMRQLLIVK